MNWKAALLGGTLFVLTAHHALSWGTAGHSIVAEIAQRRLHPEAAQQIRDLLDGNVSLASIASQADTFVLIRPQTYNWHFVNIPYDATDYDASRDCPATPEGDCAIKAIERARATLADRTLPKKDRAEALTFLIHLVADVHQPLHTADRGDAGGNRTMVTFFEHPMSLHMVWDVAIIEKQTYDWGDQVARLEQGWFPGKDIPTLAMGEPVDWALEAHRAGVEIAYAIPEDHNLGKEYYQRSLPIVERQLALAGIRLARVLNESFGCK